VEAEVEGVDPEEEEEEQVAAEAVEEVNQAENRQQHMSLLLQGQALRSKSKLFS
jgi:hypothetical protein